MLKVEYMQFDPHIAKQSKFTVVFGNFIYVKNGIKTGITRFTRITARS